MATRLLGFGISAKECEKKAGCVVSISLDNNNQLLDNQGFQSLPLLLRTFSSFASITVPSQLASLVFFSILECLNNSILHCLNFTPIFSYATSSPMWFPWFPPNLKADHSTPQSVFPALISLLGSRTILTASYLHFPQAHQVNYFLFQTSISSHIAYIHYYVAIHLITSLVAQTVKNLPEM